MSKQGNGKQPDKPVEGDTKDKPANPSKPKNGNEGKPK